MSSLCTTGEDIQDQIRTVQNLYLQLFLDITQLLGGKFVIEYHQPDLVFHHIFLYLLQLAGTDKGHGVRIIQFLIKTFHSFDTCRIGQKGQFIQVFLHFLLILFRSNQSYENSLFCLCFRYNKFFHTAKIVNSIIYVILEYNPYLFIIRTLGRLPDFEVTNCQPFLLQYSALICFLGNSFARQK